MDESKMMVLTQDEFDYIMSEYEFPIIKNRIIDGITYDHMDECCTVKFKNCVVRNFTMCVDQVNAIFLMCSIDHVNIRICTYGSSSLKLVKSVINDYGNIKYRYKALCVHPIVIDCSYVKPVPLACPSEGQFIGWKKCVYKVSDEFSFFRTCIVMLGIPEDAKRSSAFGSKCRCDKAMVLDILDINGHALSDVDTAYSAYHSGKIKYTRGQMVKADSFDNNRFNECSHGIHFFMSIEEAIDY